VVAAWAGRSSRPSTRPKYGSGTAWTGAPIVLMSIRVTATGKIAALEPKPAPLPATPPVVAPTGTRRAFLPLVGEETDLAVYDALAVPAGSQISGPAVLEHPLTTIQVPAGRCASTSGATTC
jgi:N-methylhydantoinase A